MSYMIAAIDVGFAEFHETLPPARNVNTFAQRWPCFLLLVMKEFGQKSPELNCFRLILPAKEYYRNDQINGTLPIAYVTEKALFQLNADRRTCKHKHSKRKSKSRFQEDVREFS